jgi:DNA-binding winged helix-turn-helix (wHTH) protein/Tol biopolymer transport system component
MNASRPIVFEFGPFHLDAAEHRLLRDGRVVPLTPKAFEVLHFLVQHHGRLVDKDALLKHVWPDCFVEEAATNRSVSVLRKALGGGPGEPRYIETVPKRGYRFVAPVIEITSRVETAALVAPRPGRRIWLIPAALLIATVALVAYGLSGRRGPLATSRAAVHRQITFTGEAFAPTISPDSRRVAYIERAAPEKRVLVQDLAGGDPISVYISAEIRSLRWAPDGDALMFIVSGQEFSGLVVVPKTGGPPRKFAGPWFTACWSPDGQTIVAAAYRRLMFLDPLTGEGRRVAPDGQPGWISDVDWSARTGRVLYASEDDRHVFSIRTMRADGSDRRLVLEDRAEIRFARWSPHDDAVYFSRRVDQTAGLFKVTEPAGLASTATDPVPLVTGLESDGLFGISADGRTMVFARSSLYTNLHVVQLDRHGSVTGVTTKALTHGTSLVERPSISPDGKTVLVSIGHASRANMFTVPIDGGAPTQLTFLNVFSTGGVWSRDGTRVAFAANQDGEVRAWIANLAGGPLEPVSAGTVSDNAELSWAPGRQLVFQERGFRNLQIVDPDLPRAPARAVNAEGRGGFSFPLAAPDGRTIAATWSSSPPDGGIWLVSLDGVRLKRLLPQAGFSTRPVGWSADGRSLFVASGPVNQYRGRIAPAGETTITPAILSVPIDGGPPRTLLVLPFKEVGGISVAPDGRVVCVVYSAPSDLWSITEFEGGAIRRARTGLLSEER